MNRFALITVLTLSALCICTGCDKETSTESPYIEGLTIDNYPITDGSTSTLPLNTVIACELLGLNYQWEENQTNNASKMWSVEPQIKGKLRRKFDRVVRSSQTHNSYINLIDGEADIVLTARTMSSDEKEYAEARGVPLIETPVALDAFIFIVNPQNPLQALTTEEIQSIYTGEVTDWRELGWSPESPGYPLSISPYVRNPNSGSQELMDIFVMKDLEYFTGLPVYEERLVFTMAGMLDAVAGNRWAIGYTVYYYNEQIVRAGEWLKTIGIDGVHPGKQTISDRSYPYTAEVYAVIRSDTDTSSMTYKIYQWLQTDAGKQTISKSGYLLN